MRRLLLLALVVPILVVTSLAGRSVAELDGPPNARLIVAGIEQRGNIRSSCWDGFCGVCACWAFPEARRAPAGKFAQIRVAAPLRIRRADLDGWRDAAPTVEGPAPAGPRRDFRIRRFPVRNEDGKIVARIVRFKLPAAPGDLYLDLTVGWGAGRSASYTFHLELT